jgi:CheY-like chemotaxis protein
MDNSRHILIVDDQPEFLEIFGAELRAKGYSILTASGGAEAISIAKQSHPDLILMDVQMPGMTGVETILKLKEDFETKNIKVVFLTNLGNNDAESELVNELAAQDIHAEGYIKKTEDMSSLLDQIKNHLG